MDVCALDRLRSHRCIRVELLDRRQELGPGRRCRVSEIDGAFTAGARGFTNSKSSGRVEWRVAEVQAGRAVIEFPLPGAVGRFIWTFEEDGGRTRITQRCTLHGEQAGTYAKAVGPALEAGIPAGMRKLCETMENLARAGQPLISGEAAPTATP
jgi:hypothetical protein